jgi:allantoin racemase
VDLQVHGLLTMWLMTTAQASSQKKGECYSGMRILVINPNISESVTELIEREARRVASQGTELTFATAPFGVEYIETRMEALMGGYAAACIAAERHGEYDGVVIAAFGDPGLLGIKEMLNVPVVGMTEAALASASLLGQRFSIIAISSRIKAWYQECVERSHLATRLASIRSLNDPLRDSVLYRKIIVRD